MAATWRQHGGNAATLKDLYLLHKIKAWQHGSINRETSGKSMIRPISAIKRGRIQLFWKVLMYAAMPPQCH